MCDLHPYAGIIRVRSEGLISACNAQAPLRKTFAFQVQSYEKLVFSAKKMHLYAFVKVCLLFFLN